MVLQFCMLSSLSSPGVMSHRLLYPFPSMVKSSIRPVDHHVSCYAVIPLRDTASVKTLVSSFW